MNIAFLSAFYPWRGGIAQPNALIYRTFEKHLSIKAFTFTRQYPNFLFPGSSQYVAPDDPADRIPAVPILDTINPLSYRKSARMILQSQPDLLLTRFWMPFFAPSLGTVARLVRKKGVKTIAILDNVIPHEHRPGDMALTKFFLNQHDGFIVMSDAVQQDLLSLKPDAQYVNYPHPLYNHFTPAIDRKEACSQLGLPPDKKILLFFGFIRSYKGLDILLQSLQLLPPDYFLVIAGEVYGDFTSYQEMIDKLGLKDRVQLHVRYISDHEVPLFFSAADVCVLPYKSATQSGIVPIAFHFNLPVIVTDVGGLREIVEPYGTGIVVKEVSPQAVAGAVKQFFAQDSQHYRNNIMAFKERYSWEHYTEAIIELYMRLGGQRNP